MSFTPLQAKLFNAAKVDTTLQGYLQQSAVFCWFPIQLPKGFVYRSSCVVTRQVSDVLPYVQSGPLALDGVMMQIECRDLDSLVAQALANYLVTVWFPSNGFATGGAAANFKLSQQARLDYEVQPQPAWVEILTYRIFNNVNT
jgi:hypothetical protein